MKDNTKHLVETIRIDRKKKDNNKKFKRNNIEMNNFFNYSGKQEINNRFVVSNTNYTILDRPENIAIYNDMSKYKL
tara:strand:- start:1486 stop:1713 length:228 start_codon:yes stop_codon:yes gene_type:complete